LHNSNPITKGSFNIPFARGWWGYTNTFTRPPILLRDGLPLLDWRDAQTNEHNLDLWTIEIVNNASKSVVCAYMVHKYVLANTSDYYKRLFSHSFLESEVKSSRIELDPECTDVFPYFLDYLYNYHGAPMQLQPSLEYVCPLVLLAQYFGVRQLVEDLRSYWKSAMTLNNYQKFVASAQKLDL
jgi:hypothetical protein